MAVAFKGKIIGDKDLGIVIDRGKDELNRAAERGMGLGGAAVLIEAQNNLSGTILGVKTGTLRSSVISRFKDRNGMESVLLIGTPLVYGAAHEKGANITNGFGKGINITVRARKWLFRASQQATARVNEIFRKVIEDAVARIR